MFACAMLVFEEAHIQRYRIQRSSSFACSMLHYVQSAATHDTSTYLRDYQLEQPHNTSALYNRNPVIGYWHPAVKSLLVTIMIYYYYLNK